MRTFIGVARSWSLDDTSNTLAWQGVKYNDAPWIFSRWTDKLLFKLNSMFKLQRWTRQGEQWGVIFAHVKLTGF